MTTATVRTVLTVQARSRRSGWRGSSEQARPGDARRARLPPRTQAAPRPPAAWTRSLPPEAAAGGELV